MSVKSVKAAVKQLLFKVYDVVEKLLKERHIDYVMTDVALDEIDQSNNVLQTRRQAFANHKDLVEDYSEDMDNGDIFPAPLLAYVPGCGYLVCCGRHRVAAATKHGARVLKNVYVVNISEDPEQAEIDREKLRVISRLENLKNGDRITKAEFYDGIATDIVQANGGPDAGKPSTELMKNVSRRYGIKHTPAGVRHRVSAHIMQAKCRGLGVTPPDDMGACYWLHQLSSLDKYDDVIKEASKFEAKGLSKVLKEIKDEGLNSDDAIKLLRDRNAGYRPKLTGQPPSIVDRFRLNVNHDCKLLVMLKDNANSLTEAEVAEVKKQAERFVSVAAEVLDALNAGGDLC